MTKTGKVFRNLISSLTCEDHREFVSTDAVTTACVIKSGPNALGCGINCLVAYMVTQLVIDLFQIVHIKQDESQPLRRMLHQRSQLDLERVPVAHLRHNLLHS